jgi:hypothetical protein
MTNGFLQEVVKYAWRKLKACYWKSRMISCGVIFPLYSFSSR